MSTESHAIQQAAAEFIRDRHLLGAFVNGLLRDVHTAEDVLQEIWMLLSAELEKGTVIQNQAAWCRGVARNLIRRHWEKQQMARVVAGSEALEALMDRVERCFAWADTQEHFATTRLAALDECVASLPERSRHLLSMKYTQHAAMERIAEETGQSFEAVKKALIRLRAALLECVRRKLSQQEWTP
jgi:RNA polymerase sigma-70 factor (ECF subfamily)